MSKILGTLILFSSVCVFCAEITVASFNLAMLETPAASVPYVTGRESLLKSQIIKYLSENDVDVLAVQEMWTGDAWESLKDLGNDYDLYTINANAWLPLTGLAHTTGLAFIAKSSLKISEVRFTNFNVMESTICFFGQACDRGLLELTILSEGKSIGIYNTHLTPLDMEEYQLKRRQQLNETIEFMSSSIHDVTILAGDLNISPTYNLTRDSDESKNHKWNNNSDMYYMFFAEMLNQGIVCQDTCFTYDNASKCENTQDREKNLLAAKSFVMDNEPSMRLDHIFVCSAPENKPEILDYKTTFKHTVFFRKKVRSQGKGRYRTIETHMSDHFGVETSLDI